MITKLTIDRSRWMTPDTCPDQDGELLDRTGFMCCLGFLSEACGVPRDRLRGSALPSDEPLSAFRDRLPKILFEFGGELRGPSRESAFCAWEQTLAGINDSVTIDAQTREEAIATGFRELMGIDVEFAGKYPQPREMPQCICGDRLQPGQTWDDCENCGGRGVEDDGSEDYE